MPECARRRAAPCRAAPRQVLAASAKSVLPGWSYLPFQVYANSVFADSVGQAYANKSDLNAGLQAWQSSSAQYGTQQGFTVTSN